MTMTEYPFQDIIFCALTREREKVFVFIKRTTFLLWREMICVICMNVWSLSWDLEKRNVSLHAYVDLLAKNPMNFCTDLNLFLSSINDLNPAYPVVTGDSNNKSPQWWALDKEIKNDVKLASFLSWFISASGVELSLYEKCHHNFILWKRNFNVSLPPPYIREVWNYEKAKIENIQLAVSGVNWDFHFQEKNY